MDDLSRDDLGDRMKSYEAVETGRMFDRSGPVYARIDGRGFSRFTRGMDRPFDARMAEAMARTTADLIEQTHARVGYTQSDEISLCWQVETEEQELFFTGKVQKLVSVLASLATVRFNRHVHELLPDWWERSPHFDCRVFSLPSRVECANAFLWRALDAERNAIQMVARHYFSHKQLDHVGTKDMLEILAGAGVSMDQFPAYFRYGRFLQRRTAPRELTPVELDRIPPQHRPTGPVMRASVEDLQLSHSFRTEPDRIGFIFR